MAYSVYFDVFQKFLISLDIKLISQQEERRVRERRMSGQREGGWIERGREDGGREDG